MGSQSSSALQGVKEMLGKNKNQNPPRKRAPMKPNQGQKSIQSVSTSQKKPC